MERKELLNDVIAYFRSSDHWRRTLALLQDPDPENTHIHSYVYTSIHPESLEEIIVRYFAMRGWPSVRKIDWVRPRPGLGSLHGIEPQGKPHFDFHWIYKPDVGVQAADGIENGSNLLIWNRWYIEEFYRDFPFRQAGPAEEEALRQYFSSAHWEKGLEIVMAPNTTHMHFYVEASLHPDVIRQFALAALRERGWKVYYVCPNIYLVGKEYTGKLVFMGQEPEKVYDIGWKFNPDVIIKPTEIPWNFPEPIGYDVITWEMIEEEINQHPYLKLTPEEISSVVEACTRS
ncbi:MAG: hypothetical protein D6736_01260 [Nitrospinota bacterium]|nr:MAG: hypothetical protein D6736_01260 [Nitrospinota bacterium]